MAKIEEVTALLIDEISSFQKSVEQLSEKTEVITNHKIKVDIDQIAKLFIGFEKKLNDNYHLEERQLKTIQNKLNKTIIFPNWMIVLFSLFFITLILSFGFNLYQYKKSREIEQVAFESGKSTIEKHMLSFFNDNPKTLKTYKKWSSKNKE